MIQTKELTKTYAVSKKQQQELQLQTDRLKVLDNVSFTCQAGKVTGLLGPNGAGKTTTLKIIATILKPTSGMVSIDGHDVLKDPESARRLIGFLTGSTGLYQRLTPSETVDFYGELYGMSKAAIASRKDYLFSSLEMEDFMHKQVYELSTGMRQRVSICRTLIHDPAVIILDEPTSGLDIISAQSILKMVGELRDAGKTVLMSSHHMEEIDLLCDDLVIINKGETKYNGTYREFSEIYGQEGSARGFIRVINQEKENQAYAESH